MAHRPNLSPGPRKLPATGPEGLRLHAEEARAGAVSYESDIAQLFAKFEQNSGGTLSPQFSADLALEIVLNEIVEQACLATGATGAAVVLRRGEELVCRASTGASAPALGAQMDVRAGLSGLCVQTGRVQSCDDALSDARADLEASQRLGVRSVMVVPLARPTGVVGILEVFSPRPRAFGERDEPTLEVLARRVLKNVERAADPFLLRADAPVATPSDQPRADEETSLLPPVIDDPLSGPIFGRTIETKKSRRSVDLVSVLMGLILLAGAVLLGLRLAGGSWSLGALSTRTTKASSRAVPKPQNTNVAPGSAPDAAARVDPAPLPVASPASSTTPVSNAFTTSPPGVPEGGLRVYENGREVFRMPASREGNAARVAQPSLAAEAMVTHRVEPEYPEQARARQLQGKVVLRVRVRPDGRVEDIQLVSGEPLLTQAAVDAVMQWRFKPQTGTDAADMQTQVTLNFRLPQ